MTVTAFIVDAVTGDLVGLIEDRVAIRGTIQSPGGTIPPFKNPRWLIGADSPVPANSGIQYPLQVHADTNDDGAGILIGRWINKMNSGSLCIAHSRSLVPGVHTPSDANGEGGSSLRLGDSLGKVSFLFDDGYSIRSTGGRVSAHAEADATRERLATALELETAAGEADRDITAKVRVGSKGHVGYTPNLPAPTGDMITSSGGIGEAGGVSLVQEWWGADGHKYARFPGGAVRRFLTEPA